MVKIARQSALYAAAASLAMTPVSAAANTRPGDSQTYYSASANPESEQLCESDNERPNSEDISEEDLCAILLLAGGFTLAFALILAGGGSSSGGNTPNQSNGAN